MGSVPERQARNEAIFREVNERIRTIGEPHEPDTQLELVCECSDTTCTAQLTVSVATYEVVRDNPRRFIVLPGHVWHPEAEREVERAGAFVVVEKLEEAGERAAEADPRNGGEDPGD